MTIRKITSDLATAALLIAQAGQAIQKLDLSEPAGGLDLPTDEGDGKPDLVEFVTDESGAAHSVADDGTIVIDGQRIEGSFATELIELDGAIYHKGTAGTYWKYITSSGGFERVAQLPDGIVTGGGTVIVKTIGKGLIEGL